MKGEWVRADGDQWEEGHVTGMSLVQVLCWALGTWQSTGPTREKQEGRHRQRTLLGHFRKCEKSTCVGLVPTDGQWRLESDPWACVGRGTFLQVPKYL